MAGERSVVAVAAQAALFGRQHPPQGCDLKLGRSLSLTPGVHPFIHNGELWRPLDDRGDDFHAGYVHDEEQRVEVLIDGDRAYGAAEWRGERSGHFVRVGDDGGIAVVTRRSGATPPV
jgi:hypothetical protein